MQIQFLDAPANPQPRLVAHVVDENGLPEALEALLAEGARASRFSGKAGQLYDGFVERDGTVVRVALAGIGPARGATSEVERLHALEQAGAGLAARFLSAGEAELAIDLAGTEITARETAALMLAARLRTWRLDTYHTRLTDEQKPSLNAITVAGAPEGAEAAWEEAAALAEGVEFTRALVTEPANILYPESFVERCVDRMAGTGITVRVLAPEAMAKLGMGALLGVSLGSARPPRLLVLEWQGEGEGGGGGGGAATGPTVFVGKGVTFDSGGISLKSPAGMEDMKWDMGGAGAVAGTMLALALRKSRAHVVGVCGLVENMPDGKAQRPGDVVTSMSGQTIEVINTDAEGRLVLCDALTWVQGEYNPAAIVDLATLTGAIIVSLGSEYGGMFANDDALAERLAAAGETSGDRLWRFPLSSAYDKLIDSPIADMKNVGPRPAGSITAAQFLKRFIDKDMPWAHLDIAGMVWADKPGTTWGKGATGYGVRLLDQYVRDTLES